MTLETTQITSMWSECFGRAWGVDGSHDCRFCRLSIIEVIAAAEFQDIMTYFADGP